jgi:hypothetical protein
VILSETITIWHPDAGAGVVHPIIFDRVVELSLRADVRFDPESDQDRAATQYVAMGQRTKSLRSSPLRGSKSREASSQLRG